MPVEIQGKGFVFAEASQQVYRNGQVIEIEGDFEETFWPVPAPGSSFTAWGDVCANLGDVACELKLPASLTSRDDEVPLEARFRKRYGGPLTLLDYDLYWSRISRTLSIPASSLELVGADPDDAPRLFLAPPGRQQILPGRLRGSDYEFRLPANSPYLPEDFWLFVSARDTRGVVATVGYDFGVREYVSPAGLRPHNSDSPWAKVLVDCVTASDPFNLCSMARLPYLGSVKDRPTVADILDRTVVSHPWMGRRFAQVLRQMPPRLLRMFSSVTAVVISSDIRPAIFSVVTGAVYLDPQDLWLTPAERATVDWTADYRSEFGNALQFTHTAFYLEGNQPAWYLTDEYAEGETRTIADIERPMAWLLFHELTHAGDAVPPARLPAANSRENPLEVFIARERDTASNLLENTYPLGSRLMKKLGGVLYRGNNPDNEILALTAHQAGLEFAADSANAMYAYATPREDTASLVEEVLMNFFYGVDKLEAFLDEPGGAEPGCDDYILRWGSLRRVAKPSIRERARLVLGTVLDEADVSAYLGALPPAVSLRAGVGLCQAIDGITDPREATPGVFQAGPRLLLRDVDRSRLHTEQHLRVTRPRASSGVRPH